LKPVFKIDKRGQFSSHISHIFFFSNPPVQKEVVGDVGEIRCQAEERGHIRNQDMSPNMKTGYVPKYENRICPQI